MTPEAPKTIRESLNAALNERYKARKIHPLAQGGSLLAICEDMERDIRTAIAILDATSHEPSIDARRIVSDIRSADPEWRDFVIDDADAAALIESAFDRVRRETLDDVIETSRMVQRDFDGRTGMYWEEWVLHLDEAFVCTAILCPEPAQTENKD